MSGLTLKSNTMIPTFPIKPKVRKYIALITQEGETDPVATILVNTLYGTPVFERIVAGIYDITCPNETFPESKTTAEIQPNYNWYNYFQKPYSGTLQIGTYSAPGTPADDQLYMTMITITVYEL